MRRSGALRCSCSTIVFNRLLCYDKLAGDDDQSDYMHDTVLAKRQLRRGG